MNNVITSIENDRHSLALNHSVNHLYMFQLLIIEIKLALYHN